MRFSYLLLCDAASTGSDGKVNLLGVGVRKIKLPVLPAAASLTLAGAVEGALTESGPQRFEVVLVEPNGVTTTAVEKDDAELPRETDVPDVPVQFVFMINFTRPYTQQGRYTFRVSYGDLTQEYVFVVQATGTDEPPVGDADPAR